MPSAKGKPLAFTVYQYRDPSAFGQDAVRWVAAHDQKQADERAAKKGWVPDGGKVTLQYIPQDRPGLKQLGCDLIVNGDDQ